MSFADSRSFRNLLRLGVRLGIERLGHFFDPVPNPVAPGADSLTCFHQVFCICFAFLHLSAVELKAFLLHFLRTVVLERFLQFAEEHSSVHPVLNVITRL